MIKHYKVVHQRRNKNLNQKIRISSYAKPDHLTDKEYRLGLLNDLMGHGHRVKLITYIGMTKL